jgi:SAM-dependent methyltransferase
VVRLDVEARLPQRYANPQPLRDAFRARARAVLRDDDLVLDVGAGRAPSLPLGERPSRCRYVGLDVDRAELEAAPEGAYDEIVVASATSVLPGLEGAVDVVLSYQALEHVKPLEAAFANFHRLLRPGGHAVALFAGTFSAFALGNRLVPHRLGVRFMERFLGREPDSVFPAHYDHCWDAALRGLLAPWRDVTIEPFYLAARYFSFAPPLLGAYLRYENWAASGPRRNLATHYLVSAAR